MAVRCMNGVGLFARSMIVFGEHPIAPNSNKKRQDLT